MAHKKKNPVTEGKKSFNWPDKIFGAAVLILSILVFLIIAYPLWFIIIASISNSNMVNLGKVTFLPKDIRFTDTSRLWMTPVSGWDMPTPSFMWWRERF